MLAKPVL